MSRLRDRATVLALALEGLRSPPNSAMPELADRVLVMKARTIETEIDVPLTRPRVYEDSDLFGGSDRSSILSVRSSDPRAQVAIRINEEDEHYVD